MKRFQPHKDKYFLITLLIGVPTHKDEHFLITLLIVYQHIKISIFLLHYGYPCKHKNAVRIKAIHEIAKRSTIKMKNLNLTKEKN